MSKGWIGVDLDGTLAHYDHWRGESHIGEPIPLMVHRVKCWLEDGQDVKIFTARAYPVISERNEAIRHENMKRIFTPIIDWCVKHIGQPLEITCVKDFSMIELWDDRAIQAITNTGTKVEVGREWY